MAILKNTTISGTGFLTPPPRATRLREQLTESIIQWTNTGTPASTILKGPTPTLSTTSWTCPAGVTEVEVLVVGGGGGGGGGESNINGDGAGGGGGGGVVYHPAFAVTPGTTYNVTVGTGGAGATTGVRGSNGGNSVFGPNANLVTDGTFSSGITGWNGYNSNISWFGSNSLRSVSVSGNPAGATYSFSTIVGRTYYYKADVTQSGGVTNDVRVQISGIGLIRSATGQSTVTATTTIFDYFVATSTTHILEVLHYNSQVGATVTIDNVEVRSLNDNLVAFGGGAGGGGDSPLQNGVAGGSGGGASGEGSGAATGGTSVLGRGFPGGNGLNTNRAGAGGGGAGGAGGPSVAAYTNATGRGGAGGIGVGHYITGSLQYYGGGGGGAASNNFANSTVYSGAGGRGGGGAGGPTTAGTATYGTTVAGTAGTASTGGGGGGGYGTSGGAGGSGIVVIRYVTASDSTDPRGSISYNTDVGEIEVYEGIGKGWVTSSPGKNFAPHNLLPYSQDFSQWTGNYFNNWINATVTAGQSDPFGGTTASLLTGYYSRYSTSISVTAGLTYTFSIWLKNSALVNPVVIHILGGLNGVQAGVGNSLSITSSSISSWTRYSVSYTIPASGVNQIQCGVEFGASKANVATGYSVFVYGGQLEQSSTYSLYTPTAGCPAPIPASINGYNIHSYTTTGTSSFVPAVSGTVEVLVVAGGGSGGGYGGNDGSGGGGGGGVVHHAAYPVYAERVYTVTVGAGGAGVGGAIGLIGNNGGDSIFGTITAVGGGGGGTEGTYRQGKQGGSGGGAGGYGPKLGGAGIPGQGNRGGDCTGPGDGGGGGAGGPGESGTTGIGGNGLGYSISGQLTFYGGGGGASGDKRNGRGAGGGRGGLGGGGKGQDASSSDVPVAGTANTGGGGGAAAGSTVTYGAGTTLTSGAGGSGIVIVKYRCNHH